MKRWPAAPLALFSVVVKSSDADPVSPQVQLEIEFKCLLIPSGIAGSGGVAQDRTSLTKLLESIEGRRMLKRGQGTEK